MTERKHQLESNTALQLLDRHWKWVTLAAWLILSAWFLYNRWTNIQTFTLVDTDDNMRMSQVRALLGGQDWYDLRQHRLNPPSGADIMVADGDIPMAADLMFRRWRRLERSAGDHRRALSPIWCCFSGSRSPPARSPAPPPSLYRLYRGSTTQ